MRKNIWILHHYGTPPTLTGLTRPFYFAKHLLRAGYKCTVFASSYQHYAAYNLIKDKSHFLKREEEGVPFVYVRTPSYCGNGIARIHNMLSFYLGVQRRGKDAEKTEGAPDVIIASSPHPLTCIAGIRMAKRYGCKCIAEVRDLWPESIVAYGVAGKHNPLVWMLYRLEKWIYSKAAGIIFTMEGGKDYIIEKGWDTAHGGPVDLNKVYHINNGVDLETFDYNQRTFTLEDPDLDDPNTFKVIYTGSIRRANELDKFVYAAERLRDRRDIVFLLYGEGTDREDLETYCKVRALHNVRFKGQLRKKYIPYVLSKANASLLHAPDASIMRYGLSANKLFDYLASGKPILANIPIGDSLKCNLPIGLDEDCTASPESYAAQILAAYNLPKEQYEAMSRNARMVAEQYDYAVLTDELLHIMEDCCEPSTL